jgi:serralysin
MSDVMALLQLAAPGALTARWNFPQAIGTAPAAPGGLGDAATVTTSFMQGLPAYESVADHPGFLAFDAAMQAAARQALAAWAAVCNLSFLEVPDAGEGGAIRFGRSDLPAVGGTTWWPAYAYTLGRDGLIDSVAPLARGGDVWLSSSPALDAQAAGDYGRYALLHEIGHAIGLKHPFEGAVMLPAGEDDLAHTLMTYAPPPNFGVVTVSGTPDSYRWTVASLYPSGPMPDDIAAAQFLYGANLATNAGDTHYAWAPGERFLQTIWDGGGIDTIDACN